MRTTPPAQISLFSSFVALRPSQAGSTTELAGRAAPRSDRPSYSPLRSHSSRSSTRANHAGEVLLQIFARLSEQLSAQSTSLTSVLKRFETLHSATPPRSSCRSARQEITASRSPSRRASPSPQRSLYRLSALDAGALLGGTLPFPMRPLAQDPRATAHQLTFSARIASHVFLGAAQKSHQLAPPSLACFVSCASLDVAPLALPTLSTNPLESPQSGLSLAPLALPALSFASLPSLVQYAPQYLQTAPRVASTVVGPAALQPGDTSALFVSAPLQFEAAAVQPTSHAGAPLSICAHFSHAGAPLIMGAHPSQVGALLSMGAQPLQFGAPLGFGA